MKQLLAVITAVLLCLTMTACSNDSKYIIPEGETAYEWGVSMEYVKAREEGKLFHEEQKDDGYTTLDCVSLEQMEKGTRYSCPRFFFEDDKLVGIAYCIHRKDEPITTSQTVSDYIEYLDALTEQYGKPNKAYFYGWPDTGWVTNADETFPKQKDWAIAAEETSHALVLNDTWTVDDTFICLQNEGIVVGNLNRVTVSHWQLSSKLYQECIKEQLVYDPTQT